MRIPHLKIHQGLCGLAVALALATLPLPAMADETPTVPATGDTSQSTPAETPALNNVADNVPTLALETLADAPLTSVSLPLTDPAPSTAAPAASLNIANTVDSNAASGSAAVTNNEKAGSANSGNAVANATVLNVANANGLTAGDFTTFQCDVKGDIQENLVIDPTSLLPICKTTTVGSTQQPGSSQSLQTGASLVDILNNIVLSATSGDAAVDGNEEAGDATSGDAAALANIVNIANSAIGAKNSFLGVINIYGSLKGDILVPQSIVDSLISQTGDSGIPVGDTSIANNVDASATSGNATVSDNEEAGNASSGDAATSLQVYNLTGQEVVAKNSLLVFVNVLGKWVGLIVPANAGNGNASALLGGGVQPNAPGTVNGIDEAGESTTKITNNVTVAATSGDASVTNNEKAGNATSGKAQAGANLVNITHSNFWLDNWFGMLFINVLGDWLGDFDIQANALPAPAAPGQPSQPIRDVQVYQIAEPTTVKPATSPKVSFQQTNRNGTNVTDISAPAGTVLSAADDSIQFVEGSNATKAVKLDLFALGAIILALTLLIATGTMILRRWHTA